MLPSLYHKADIQMCHGDQVVYFFRAMVTHWICSVLGFKLQPSLVRGGYYFLLIYFAIVDLDRAIFSGTLLIHMPAGGILFF